MADLAQSSRPGDNIGLGGGGRGLEQQHTRNALFFLLIPMSDKHLISPLNITPGSHVKVTRKRY